MGADDVAELEAQWTALVNERGYICCYCGHAPCRDERQVFSKTNMCAPCAQVTGGHIDWPPRVQHDRERFSKVTAEELHPDPETKS